MLPCHFICLTFLTAHLSNQSAVATAQSVYICRHIQDALLKIKSGFRVTRKMTSLALSALWFVGARGTSHFILDTAEVRKWSDFEEAQQTCSAPRFTGPERFVDA